MSRKGILIALSGVDCAGKSTQRDFLVAVLRARGHSPRTVYTRPGYTPGLRVAKRLLRALGLMHKPGRSRVSEAPSRFPRRAANLGHPLERRLWLTAALLDLLWLYAVRIRLWRARGLTVVCNRYLLDALVDFRVNFPGERVEEGRLCRLLRRFSARPEAAFCLLVTAGETSARARAKARFHRETPEVLEQRWREYRALSEDLGVQVLDGARPVTEIARSIQERVAEALLPRSGPTVATEQPSINEAGSPEPRADLGDWSIRAQRQE